jgi:hypothetical protein
MRGWLMPVSEWAPVFVDWMHPAAIICAVLLPLIRAVVLKARGHGPCFQTPLVAHDVASGFVFPSFLALALSGLSKDIAANANGHAVELAGAMGIVYTLAGIFKGSHGTSNANSNGDSGNSRL